MPGRHDTLILGLAFGLVMILAFVLLQAIFGDVDFGESVGVLITYGIVSVVATFGYHWRESHLRRTGRLPKTPARDISSAAIRPPTMVRVGALLTIASMAAGGTAIALFYGQFWIAGIAILAAFAGLVTFFMAWRSTANYE